MDYPLGIPEVYCDPDIHGGQPLLESGIPITLVLDMFAQALLREEMRDDYGKSDDPVRIALRFAAEY